MFMAYFFQFVALLSSLFLYGATDPFSRDRLNSFYDVYLCNEKSDLARASFGSRCSSRPPRPPAPPFVTGLLPIILVNHSGLPDDQVYIVVTGKDVSDANQIFLQINTSTGVGTLHNVMVGENATSYSYKFSDLPETTGGRVFYSPELRSGIVWFSLAVPLNMPVIAGPSIQQPGFNNSSDPNYLTNFDIAEYTFLKSGSPQIAADATAISFFSLPLFLDLAGATSASSTVGLYQPRSVILDHAASTFNAAYPTEKVQWNQLFLTSGGNTLRLLSPGKGIATPVFDKNYLNNAAAYTYSYLTDISNFYNGAPNELKMSVLVTNPSTATYNYSGKVVGSNFVFTSTNGGPVVSLPFNQTGPTYADTTTFKIFSGINFISPLPAAGTADDAVSKLLQEAIIAGLIPIPLADTLDLAYLPSHQSIYYTVNPLLTPPGATTGPWYDLYSKALHSLGIIYAFAFDEPLWPDVLLGGPFVENSSYLSITLGEVN
jgi:hypothetical protein